MQERNGPIRWIRSCSRCRSAPKIPANNPPVYPDAIEDRRADEKYGSTGELFVPFYVLSGVDSRTNNALISSLTEGDIRLSRSTRASSMLSFLNTGLDKIALISIHKVHGVLCQQITLPSGRTAPLERRSSVTGMVGLDASKPYEDR